MNIKDIRNLADGTQLVAPYKVVFTKTADGLYCGDNNHLYTWWNVEYSKMADGLELVGCADGNDCRRRWLRQHPGVA